MGLNQMQGVTAPPNFVIFDIKETVRRHGNVVSRLNDMGIDVEKLFIDLINAVHLKPQIPDIFEILARAVVVSHQHIMPHQALEVVTAVMEISKVVQEKFEKHGFYNTPIAREYSFYGLSMQEKLVLVHGESKRNAEVNAQFDVDGYPTTEPDHFPEYSEWDAIIPF